MRIPKAIALAIIVAIPTLVSLSPAQAASECPATGTLWVDQLDGLFYSSLGSTCLFPIRMDGVVSSSSSSQGRQLMGR